VVGGAADRGKLDGGLFLAARLSQLLAVTGSSIFAHLQSDSIGKGAQRKSVVHAETVNPDGTRRCLGLRAVSVPGLGSFADWGLGTLAHQSGTYITPSEPAMGFSDPTFT
jgi:hypothetical protein